jgi:hypothetical protein
MTLTDPSRNKVFRLFDSMLSFRRWFLSKWSRTASVFFRVGLAPR